MNINTSSIVSITEANQNFSKVARLVDEHGVAVILKNNVPRYIITDFSEYKAEQMTADEDVKAIAGRLIAKHRVAFKELAK
jgi:antitoxin Phd